jgi:polyhydroxyalkanoate synthase subunit PhaC
MSEGPMSFESWWAAGERAAGSLAPETDLFAEQDMASFTRSLIEAARDAAVHPAATSEAIAVFASRLALLPGAALSRWLGLDDAPPITLDPKDRRFADPAWKDNPGFYSLRLFYEMATQLTQQLVGGPDLDRRTAAKAQMAAQLWLDALAPTNFLLTNPAALKRAFDTGGMSLLRGASNFVDDLVHNGGRPRQVDTTPFTLGVNLAATPSKVVYRNHLMELLQYEPQTPQVRSAPLLCSPPWINKYYVMDLAPNRSFIEWAVRHGRTVFAISYRNPGPEMSGVTLDDYLLHGPRQSLDVIQEITGAETIDIVGLCLGGALTVITDAFLSDAGDSRVGTLTLLNTMVDYTDPGALALFTDETTVARLEKQMAKEGHLPGKSMAGTFDVMRANDLIFNYVVANWLMGQSPPAFDILAWNADATRMPAAMHTFYLRNFYVENKLAKGELEIAGRVIRPSAIKKDTYIVSAENDHIVPWRSAYTTTQLVSGPVRFVLSSGGHIAGIVNPPGPKPWHLVADELPPKPDDWRKLATRVSGSWWDDWAVWSDEHSGELVDPPRLGSDTYPVLEDGPGQYIHT